jgi:hypothetical protein
MPDRDTENFVVVVFRPDTEVLIGLPEAGVSVTVYPAAYAEAVAVQLTEFELLAPLSHLASAVTPVGGASVAALSDSEAEVAER